MKPHFFILALLVVASLAAAPAAAQTNETDVPEWFDESELEQCQEPQAVDSSTVICSSTLTDDGQYAELVIRSDETQRITLTDAGGFMAGGEINRQTFTVRADEPNTLRLRVTTVDGFAGVSVDTGSVLYAVPLDRSTTLIGPPWSASDAQLAALFAAISTAGVSAIVVLRSVYGKTEDPERIA
jgi:hypothetical protein